MTINAIFRRILGYFRGQLDELAGNTIMNFMLNGESREIADVCEGRKMNIVYSGEQDIINLRFVRHDEWSGGV